MNNLISKLLSDSITEEEKKTLRIWLKNPKNKKVFNAQVRHAYTLNLLYNKINEEEAYNKVFKTIEQQNKPIPLYKRNFIKYAAAIVLFMAIGYFYVNKNNLNKSNITISETNIKVGTDKATLTLENGTNIFLEKGQNYISNNVESNGKALTYKIKKDANKDIAYNYLTVPRGGQYNVTLADGTKVWLNSESQLKYPVHFIKGQTRHTELVYGEAYFDVSPSTNHDGAKFKVLTNGQEVEVLGTEFNIKAYKNDNATYTTLIEGSVSVNKANNNKLLIPNQQAVVFNKNEDISIYNIDVYNEISWKEGVFSFKNKPLKEIMATLSRWYDVDIIFENKDLEDDLFGGVFDKSQKISEILNLVQQTNAVSFKKEKNVIIVK
ncbi:FecR family protein [Algibacter sp. Ld11]|uniref:FecR family protein n=1 Tax=Algibacter sp. Ld11 TaxID=649150 RepID=UPI0038654855